MDRSSLLFPLLVALLLVLAGCTGPAETTATPGSTNGASTTTPSPTELDTTTTTTPTANGTLEVHAINVGQSTSTLIVGPTGETMLIDSGDFTDDGEYVLQYLQRHNITRIDHFVVTHADADHIGGNAAIINYYETKANGIGAIYDPGIAASTQTYEEYLDAVETHNVPLYETREGDLIPFDGISLQVMGPPEPYLDNEARNENSIVLKLTYGQTSFLLPGDGEADQEQYLVENYGSQLQSTVLLAGHHGSASSSNPAFLDAVQPKVALISSAYDSRYDHPNTETLERLAARNITTYWTATHGDMVFRSDGQTVTVRTQQAAPTKPLALREGNPIAPGATQPLETRARVTASGETQSATPITTDGGTTTSPSLSLADVHADAEGDDRSNLNDEYIVLRNDGQTAIDMSGWTVADEAGHSYTIPEGMTLEAGSTITLHTGSGQNTATDLYWNAGSPVWNNGGDTVIVTTASGERILEESYA
ncbi:lamin tail domain-containing protein [Haloarcula nitratireducens]|uniref:Lamin tail domain-containing protein n=1 Tax=Haloarcula nitratireducens TaxID=2487749 RepID=A0AAW4PI09_9EURY|nr:lamin tail domain-containing protein [Halomicroarcula nitratireducens]MBX0297213.1 lamin tail domain-containing protein [Halomicroarcula nitratireducens]